MQFEMEKIVCCPSLVLIGLCTKPVPHIEWVLLILPQLLAAKFGNQRAVPSFFPLLRQIVCAELGITRDQSIRRHPDERARMSLRCTSEESLEVLLLL